MKKNVWIHVGMIAAMLVTSLIYFSPVMSGKIVRQLDIVKFESMVKETKDFHEATGDYAHWNSAMFSGMPGYQIGGNPPVKSVYQPIQKIGTLGFLGMDRNAGVLFFYLIGFYVALCALGCKPWLSLVGALAFGLGSYNIIIIEAGHITKAWSLAMMAPILAGMLLCLRKPREGKEKWRDWLWGGILFTMALGLQLLCNHIQITYYTVIGAVVLGLTYAIVSIKQHYIKEFFIALGILVGGAALSFACNARNLMVSMEYSKETMRGGNELTITPDTIYHNGSKGGNNNANGLNIDYAFGGWSYGIGETYTLLVPRAMGGGSSETVGNDSQWASVTGSENAPLYWGDQRFTSGPVYFGAIVFLLFLMGMIVVKGNDRWWILAATLVSVMLSWGDHFLLLNEWVFNNLPLYNKFRTPSMALVLANVCMVLMAALTLKHIFGERSEEERRRINRAIYWAGSITAGALIVVLIAAGSLSFVGPNDAGLDNRSSIESQLLSSYARGGSFNPNNPEHMEAWNTQIWPQFQEALSADRKSLFTSDSLRSLVFILLAAGTLWLYNNKRIKKSAIALSIIGVLVVVDLWGVDRRYLNSTNFVDKLDPQVSFVESNYDRDIDQMAAKFGDTNYRVYTLRSDPFNDSHPAAFHHQIGGYSAVKMSRYQNLINFYLSYGDMNVLNMLNTRYFVTQDGQVQRNPYALGNCWLVDNIKAVDNVNDEILSLHDFDPATTAVLNTKEFPELAEFSSPVAGDTIWMEHQTTYNPDYLKYHSRTSGPRLAVFSEIYYAPDWRVYIDEKPVDHFRVNYVLRGLVIPAGDHVIEFRNEAPLFHKMDTVTIISSIVSVLLIGGSLFLYYRKRKEE